MKVKLFRILSFQNKSTSGSTVTFFPLVNFFLIYIVKLLEESKVVYIDSYGDYKLIYGDFSLDDAP